MAAFTLAHLSDPHCRRCLRRGCPTVGKRASAISTGRATATNSSPRRLDALVSDLQAQAPDHIAVTGDLVNLALDAEFEPARAWLEASARRTASAIVPGNHDAYVRIDPPSLCRDFARFLRGVDAGRRTFPSLRRRGPLALIGVSSAVPTAALDGDRTARPGPARSAGAHRWTTFPPSRLFGAAPDPSPAGSDSRVKRLTDSNPAARAAEATRREPDPARARPRPFDSYGHRWPRSARSPRSVCSSASATRPWPSIPPRPYNLFSIARDGTAWRCEQTVAGRIDDALRVRQLSQTRLI